MSLPQLLARGGGFNLREESFQVGLAVEEDFEVFGVLQVFHQRGVGQHGSQGSPQSLRPGFAAAIAFQVSKEPLHNIVGALGLDRLGTLGCGHDQRGGKELGAIVLDLLDHFLEGGGGGKIGTGADLGHKLVDLLFDVFHLDDFAGMVESLARMGWGDAHDVAQLIEELDFGFHSIQSASQGTIRNQVVEVEVQVVKGQIFPPGLAGRQSFEGLEERVNLLGAAGQGQQRPVKGEAVTLTLLQAGQNPVGQQIGRQQWGVGQRLGRQTVGWQLVERLPQGRVGVDLFLPSPQPGAQPAGRAVTLEPLAQSVILGAKEVFAQVAQEMEVTDEVRQAGKDLLDGGQNAFGHIMDQGQRGAERVVDLAQERDNPVGLFAGQLDVAQDDFHDGIYPGHQQWALVFISGIQVQDVAAPEGHRLLEPGGALAVGQGQKGNEPAAQFAHGAGAQMNMLAVQLAHNLADGLGV